MSNLIIPQHVAYPRVFVSLQTYLRKDERWAAIAEDCDPPLNALLKQFVDEEGAVITQVSPPSVQVYSEEPDRRVYITSVSVLYVPAKEGTDDRQRSVDS